MKLKLQNFILNKLTCAVLSSGFLLAGCSQPPSDVSVSQLAPQQESQQESQPELETPASSNDAIHPASPSPQSTIKPHVVRKEITKKISGDFPKVILSTAHSSMCRVRVGDEMPELKLPQLDNGEVAVSSLYGNEATVVLFWQPDRWMSHTALADLQREVASSAEPEKVAVIGIAVETPQEKIAAETESAGTSFPQLVDAEGKAFSQVGMVMLPRIYVLDSAGRIVWFDIEYSESTRRELKETLDVLTGKN